MSIAKKITNSAASIALLVLLQFLTRSFGQLVTGSSVNFVLAVTALALSAGIASAAALLSPFLAFLLGIGPAQIALVPAVAAGNLTYVILIGLLGRAIGRSCAKRPFFGREAAVLLSAAAKCLVLFLLIVKLIGPAFLPPKALPAIAASFGILQFFTAAIGGTLAAIAAPILKKALDTAH